MEQLRSVSVYVVALLLGGLLLLVGVGAEFTIAGTGIKPPAEAWVRAFLVIFGIALIIYGLADPFFNGRVQVRNRQAKNSLPHQPLAQEFFFTLDDERATRFPLLIKDAVKISILSRTAVNLLGQYRSVFKELAKQNCKVQLLFVDPDSESAKLVYGKNYGIYKNNVASAARHLRDIVPNFGDRLETRVVDYSPTLSIIMVEKRSTEETVMQVQLYFFHSATGRDRPIFHVDPKDNWYWVFKQEFETMWADARDWDVADFVNRTRS